jgi:hypothetical protein
MSTLQTAGPHRWFVVVRAPALRSAELCCFGLAALGIAPSTGSGQAVAHGGWDSRGYISNAGDITRSVMTTLQTAGPYRFLVAMLVVVRAPALRSPQHWQSQWHTEIRYSTSVLGWGVRFTSGMTCGW